MPARTLADLAETTFDRAYGGVPHYRGYRGYAAVCEFFGLTDPQATRLFSPKAYRKDERFAPGAVVRRVRELLDATRATPKVEEEVVEAMSR